MRSEFVHNAAPLNSRSHVQWCKVHVLSRICVNPQALGSTGRLSTCLHVRRRDTRILEAPVPDNDVASPHLWYTIDPPFAKQSISFDLTGKFDHLLCLSLDHTWFPGLIRTLCACWPDLECCRSLSDVVLLT